MRVYEADPAAVHAETVALAAIPVLVRITPVKDVIAGSTTQKVRLSLFFSTRRSMATRSGSGAGELLVSKAEDDPVAAFEHQSLHLRMPGS